MLTPENRDGLRVLHKVPPQTRFTTLVPTQQSHRVPNLLTFHSVEGLSTTLAFALGVPRLITDSWAGQALPDVLYTLAGPRPHHVTLRRGATGWQVIVSALDDVQRIMVEWNDLS